MLAKGQKVTPKVVLQWNAVMLTAPEHIADFAPPIVACYMQSRCFDCRQQCFPAIQALQGLCSALPIGIAKCCYL